MKKRRNTQKGLTIVETVMGISIFVLIMMSLTLFSRNIWFYSTFISGGLENNNAARQTTKIMTAEIRTASTADTGAYTIALANSTTFTFYSDTDGDGLKEKIRYFLSGTEIKRGSIKPAGSPLSYNSADEKISTMVRYVSNSSIFSYYDENYDGTTSALSSPVSIPLIRLVKITITIDNRDPNRPPAPVTFSTQVSLRNLKDNL